MIKEYISPKWVVLSVINQLVRNDQQLLSFI